MGLIFHVEMGARRKGRGENPLKILRTSADKKAEWKNFYKINIGRRRVHRSGQSKTKPNWFSGSKKDGRSLVHRLLIAGLRANGSDQDCRQIY